jgi:hypothetical protein
MNGSKRSSSPVTYRCPDCSRRHVVLPGVAVIEPPKCGACGGTLRAEPLASGVYEIRRARRSPRRAAAVLPPKEHVPDAAKEEDLGYGESHGYGPAHGGPTGPGDAPAPTPAAPSEDSP